MRATCDLSYAIQAEQIERRALAEMTLAPHLEDSSQVRPPDVALAEFHEWLIGKPKELTISSVDLELFELIGVR